MSSIDDFTRQGLAAAVARVCTQSGWETASTSAIRTMTDVLHEYCSGLAKAVKKYSEVTDSTLIGSGSPCVEDVVMAYRDRRIRLAEIRKYLKHQQNIETELPSANRLIPPYPVPAKSTNLNMMKPGSREIVTRPVHVHEHLPTMYPVEQQSDEKSNQNFNTANNSTTNDPWNILIEDNQPKSSASDKNADRPLMNNIVMAPVHRRLREIKSVVMTTSGYLSPSREGRLPESRLVLPPPQSTSSSSTKTSTVTSSKPISNPPEATTSVKTAIKIENRPQQRHIKKPPPNKIPPLSSSFTKEKPSLASGGHKTDLIKTVMKKPLKEEFSSVKKPTPSKKISAIQRERNHRKEQTPKSNRDKLKTNALNAIFDRLSPAAAAPQSGLSSSQSSSKRSKNNHSHSDDESEKLNAEPDKRKLNIFKKISTKSDKSSAARQAAKPPSNNTINTLSRQHEQTASSVAVATTSADVSNIDNNKKIKKEKTPEPVRSVVADEKLPPTSTITSLKTEPKEDQVLKPNPVAKKRKKKQKSIMPVDDLFMSDFAVINNVKKKPKIANDVHPMPPSPVKFSFFGNLPPPIPPSLASNPLVPKYTIPPCNILTAKTVEKSPNATSQSTPVSYLPPLPGEDDYQIPEEVSSSPPTLVKEKKESSDEMKKERKKSKKKKDKKDKRRERKRKKEEKLLGKSNKEKSDSTCGESNRDDSNSAVAEEPTTSKEVDLSLVPKIKLKLAGSNTSPSTMQRKLVIKPIKRSSKSPPISDKVRSPIVSKKSPNEKRNADTIIKSPKYTIKDDHLPPVLTMETKELVEVHKDRRTSKSRKVSSTTDNFKATTPPVNDSIDDVVISSPPSTSVTVDSPTNVNIKSSKTHKSKPHKKSTSKKSTAIRQNVPAAFYYDEAGNQVWICPTCTQRDDGSPMIGCDGCDAWYHWVCVGIQCPPDCAVWYCMSCLAAKRVAASKRGRPPLKKKTSISSLS
ncbi:transcription initiation factor TFIID subunit 3 [Adelges cooleyi]|uniref:transcription initiation factor TFIID subunit 3 n=1 Tax=Adelges cooleyi TaxID=133065 RepID=UPI00217F490A|nr:transcription initiation factor TFIID subunit 3 [Adelges cooleyi]